MSEEEAADGGERWRRRRRREGAIELLVVVIGVMRGGCSQLQASGHKQQKFLLKKIYILNFSINIYILIKYGEKIRSNK